MARGSRTASHTVRRQDTRALVSRNHRLRPIVGPTFSQVYFPQGMYKASNTLLFTPSILFQAYPFNHPHPRPLAMFSLLASLLLSQFLIIPSTVALILPPSQALDIPASSPAPIPLTLPTAFRPSAVFKTNTTSPPSDNVVFHCDAQYGHNLGFASCQDALSQIHWRRDPRTRSFGLRGTGQDYDVLLPYRAISCRFSPLPDVIHVL